MCQSQPVPYSMIVAAPMIAIIAAHACATRSLAPEVLSFRNDQSDTPAATKPRAVLTFIVARPGTTPLNHSIPRAQPIKTSVPITISAMLAYDVTVRAILSLPDLIGSGGTLECASTMGPRVPALSRCEGKAVFNSALA